MDPITFAQLVLRRWWLFVLCGIAGVGIAYYMADSTPPRYVSTVSLQLNASGRSPFLPYASEGISTDTSPVTALAASYREVLRSRAFGQVVVQQLQLPLSADAIGSAVNAALVPSTNILHVSVTWDNPSDAQQLAQRIAEIFIVENQRRQQNAPVTQAQLANMEQAASDLQDQLGPLQQREQQLSQAVSRGDLSHLAELTPLEERLASVQSSHANLLVEISRIRSSFDTAVIVDNATPAGRLDSTPILQAVVFGLGGSLGVALGLALVLEYLEDAVRSRRDILEIAGVPPLARIRHASGGWRRSNGRRKSLIMLNPGRSASAEAFRSLRAGLRLATPSQPLRSLAVTSAGPRDGKTFVACNLAIALAQSGKRVLLVDADLRRSMVHVWFGVPNQRGFANALIQLQGGGADEAPAGVIASGIDNLWLLPAGDLPASPAELLGSDALPRLMDRLSQRWDLVVFDSAPVGPVADTLLLASHASASMLVARCGRTRRTALQGALGALMATGRPVVGIVLNDERPDALSRFSRYDYYHHGYWSEVTQSRLGQADDRIHALQNGGIN